MLGPQLIAAAVLAAAGFGSGWLINGWRLGNDIAALQAEKQQLFIDAQAALRSEEKKHVERHRRAVDAAAHRSAGLRRDADHARAESERLRDALAAAAGEARDTPAACPDRAAALADVLRDVEAEGRELAATCDRHTSDIRTLIEAWPKE